MVDHDWVVGVRCIRGSAGLVRYAPSKQFVVTRRIHWRGGRISIASSYKTITEASVTTIMPMAKATMMRKGPSISN